jgi:hypothetical protein
MICTTLIEIFPSVLNVGKKICDELSHLCQVLSTCTHLKLLQEAKWPACFQLGNTCLTESTVYLISRQIALITIMHVNEYKPCSQESTFPTLLPNFQIQQGVLLFGHLVPGTANEKMCYEY